MWALPTVTAPALALTSEQKLFSEAWRVVNRAYLDETFNGQNWWRVRQDGVKQNLADREATYGAIEQMLTSLGDPFTRLLRPNQYQSLQVSTAGELMGVGLQIALDPETRHLIVVTPIPGSPAEAAGIESGDRILTVDGIETDSISLEESALHLQGLRGTPVNVEILRRGATTPETLTIIRDVITLNPVISQLKTEDGLPALGYLRLTQFNGKSGDELGRSIQDLQNQGAEVFILDLRNNPGGLLQAGIDVARLWLDKGTIVYTVDRRGMMGFFQANGTALTQAPLVVLVNEGTASASEILAGALQENDRALLVGETTFGKGLIQSLFKLSDGSGMAVTVAKYETPLHHDINKLGIQPDQVVSDRSHPWTEVTGPEDLQYQAALDLLRQSNLL